MKLVIVLLMCCGCNSLVHNNRDDSIYLDSEQLIKKHNYSCEKHLVQTEDGYILKLFRIPRKGPPILMVHGIGDSSDSWLVLGPEESLGFRLSDIGFDVWLMNVRGNKYSKRHVKRLSRKEYWHFSFEEMGSMDLPATIDYILSETQRKTLTYIGFSQGSTIFLVMCSLRPEYNKKINHSVLLAPVAWIDNTKYPFMPIVAQKLQDWSFLTNQIGVYEIFPANSLQNIYHTAVCTRNSFKKHLCALEYFLSYGLSNFSYISPDKFPVISSHIPAGMSTFTLFHFIQNYVTGRFQKFDYEIVSHWGSSSRYPRKLPEYNVSTLSVPTTMFASGSDWFSDEEDVNRLRLTLRTVANYIFITEDVDFSHIEFVYGSRANTLVNKPLIKILLNLLNSL